MNRQQMVRLILTKCGRNPSPGLDTGTRSELGTAEEILDQVSREVQQAHRWAFSDRLNQEITPDVNGKLAVPAGTLFIESDNTSSHLELVQVGEFLYDRQNQTDVFTNTTRVRVSLLYKPECLPMHVRRAVVDMAAAEFAAQRSSTSPELAGMYGKLDGQAKRSMAEAQVRDMQSKPVDTLASSNALAPEGWYIVGAHDNATSLYWNGHDAERR